VRTGELVRLDCAPEALNALAGELMSFGPTEGAPDWLVSAVWLQAGSTPYLAAASVEVLPNGFVARRLSIATRGDLLRHLDAELPNVSAHLLARGSAMDLPPADPPPLPQTLRPWPAGPYSTHVLVRFTQRPSGSNQVACALLFTSEAGQALLVGTDVSSLAMVLSEDAQLISRYREPCEALTPAEYLALLED
jgi:hypothetical protein